MLAIPLQGSRPRTSAHFPKFVYHRGAHFHELRKIMGTSKHIDSSAAFLFEVPGSNSPVVLQELQIGGTSNGIGGGSMVARNAALAYGLER
jgi:hypothetical protein